MILLLASKRNEDHERGRLWSDWSGILFLLSLSHPQHFHSSSSHYHYFLVQTDIRFKHNQMQIIAVSAIALWQALVQAAPPADTAATVPASPAIAAQMEEVLLAGRADLLKNVFIYQAPDMQWYESDVFTLDSFLRGIEVMSQDGVANQYFYLGDENDYRYGVVNIAAFLAQVMKESLQYNACDENNWDLVNGQYPISNSCGQLNQSYQDYKCPAGQEHMECPVDPDMQIVASTNAKWYGAPGPFYCAPKTVQPTTGYWDYTYECNRPWESPPQTCVDYENQKAGREMSDVVVANRNGRTDVEGCCWWGRGAIQTSGVCNYGRLNYFLGKRAADEGRPSRYPTVDLCRTPEAICASEEYPELKWVAGLFYWMDSVQTYNEGGWEYLVELHKFVDGGMQDGDAFINAVSGIVNRGCHNPPCATGPLDGGPERAQNFRAVLTALRHIPGSPFVAPVAAPPTNPPVTTTVAPVAATPTETPVQAPVDQPVQTPVEAPVDQPVGTAPVATPVEVSSPTSPPVAWNGVMCCDPGETSHKPIPGCRSFYRCVDGQALPNSLTTCPGTLVFDVSITGCNWSVNCQAQDCATAAPTRSPTQTPGVVLENGAVSDSLEQEIFGATPIDNTGNGNDGSSNGGSGSSPPLGRGVTAWMAGVALGMMTFLML